MTMSTALSLGLPAAAGSLATFRTAAATLAHECGLGRRGIDDVRLAVSEAATQILFDGRVDEVRLEAAAADGELAVLVAGRAALQRAETTFPRPETRMGLPVIAALASRVEVARDAGGARLRMTFPCPSAAAPPAVR